MTLAVEKWVAQGVSGDMDKVWRSTLKEEESKKRKDGRGRKTSKRLWYMHEGGRAECGARGFTEREQ